MIKHEQISLYIHIPWCIKKCPYCDFNSHELKDGELSERQYANVLVEDFKQDLLYLNRSFQLNSIFIGGGTPSLFSPLVLEGLLEKLSQLISFSDNIEITLEANPGTIESQKFKNFRQIGINRLSIGIQSFNDVYLKKLGRIHDAKQAINAVKLAHDAEFENINLDLMFGLPNQSKKEMLADVQQAIQLAPTHISYYQLTLEPNTLFHKFPPKLPEDEVIFQAQMEGQKLLSKAGYQQYEVSAYAKQDWQCQHNLNYWHFGDYIGIGAGAHGKLSLSKPDKIVRSVKPKHPEQYLNALQPQKISIAKKELPVEFLMNQLRVKQGFALSQFAVSTGLSVQILLPFILGCVEKGLMICQAERYYCTEQGWNFLDVILQQAMEYFQNL